jgi:transposase-like protein
MAKVADLGTLGSLSEEQAREKLEALRWPQGAVCPKCGTVGEAYKLTPKAGSSTRKGLWKCRACRSQFTVTVGTIFEDSHIPLSKWLMAIHLLCASKKGMSAHQLHRMLGVTYKSAWFMAHRIRYAMTQPPLVDKLRGIVEVDETFVGGIPKNRHKDKREPAPAKVPVVSLVSRDGSVRSTRVPNVTGATLKGAVREYVDRSAKIMTDGNLSYVGLDKEFASHESVNHLRDEYVRGPVSTNTVESYFALLKRGIIGTYHHVSGHHLPAYLAEFDQRWNTRKLVDRERAVRAIRGSQGKRLTYKPLTQRGQLG